MANRRVIKSQARIQYYVEEPADQTAKNILNKALRERFHCSFAKSITADNNSASIYVGPQADLPVAFGNSGPPLGEEGFSIHSRKGKLSVLGNTARARLYGVSHLAEKIPANRIAERSFEIERVPVFPIREWSTMTLQANGSLPLGGNFDRSLEELVQATKYSIAQAPKYGINGLQLTGRGGVEGGVDIDWFIRYRRYPEVYGPYYRHVDRGKMFRLTALRDIGRACHAHGLQLVIWDHEIIVPPALRTYLEKAINKNGFSCKAVREFIRNKYEEFFEEVPEVDCINLTLSEVSGIRLLHREDINAGDKKAMATTSRDIRTLIEVMWEACVACGKGLQVRSYNMKPTQQEVMYNALKDLPKEIVIMTKYTAVDFRGVEYEDNPLIGAFPKHRQIVEFTLTPECNGFGYVPAILADFYKERLKRGLAKGIAGAVGRLDYTLQFSKRCFFTSGPPVQTFATPNEFNIVAFSNSVWNPQASLQPLWKEWTRRRYGKRLAPIAEKILKKTEEITQRIFNVKGFHLLSHLDQPPALFMIDTEIDADQYNWRMMYFGDDPELKQAYQALLKPTDKTVAECVESKEIAENLSRRCLRELVGHKSGRKDNGRQELYDWFTRLEVAAGVFKNIANLYFRLRQLRNQQIAGSQAQAELAPHLYDFLDYCLQAEGRIGFHWPLYHAVRGVDVYELPWHMIEDRSQLPANVMHRLERLWLALLDVQKPTTLQNGNPCTLSFVVPAAVSELKLIHRRWEVTLTNGVKEIIPGSVAVFAPVHFNAGEHCMLSFEAGGNAVTISKCK